MSEIKLLDSQTIDKIAAGEVIERPVSVVKELVENAIDAGATAVSVHIKDGGISMIRVTDNGRGIPGAQVPLAFQRHATSKIRSVEDLLTVSSLGFRGEALSSISAVARVELFTKTKEDFMGIHYMIEGGRERLMEGAGVPEGTTFTVRDLFYNTPARRKYLKTPQTEGSYVQELMTQFALANPHIALKLSVNGQTKLQTTGNLSLKEVVYQVCGRGAVQSLVPVSGERSPETGADTREPETMKIEGFLGKPFAGRGNRNGEYYFINGRCIRSNTISKALEDGYKGYLMQHKFPFAVLYFTFPQRLMDVNVHPAKRELRFQNDPQVYEFVYDTVRRCLGGTMLLDEERTEEPEEKAASPVVLSEPFEKERMEESRKLLAGRIREQMSTLKESSFMPDVPLKKEEEVREKTVWPASSDALAAAGAISGTAEDVQPVQMELFSVQKESLFSSIRLIGQLFDTYWLAQWEDKFYMIDQHAAHEKILYEETVKRLSVRQMTSQVVSPPVVLHLSPLDREKLEVYREGFEQMGYRIESFGGDDFALTAVPDNLYRLTGAGFFMDVLDELETERRGKAAPDVLLDRIASVSCKAAVKGNMRLSAAEAEAMVRQLMTLDDPFHCPHGRPVMVAMSRTEIEKKFKRITG